MEEMTGTSCGHQKIRANQRGMHRGCDITGEETDGTTGYTLRAPTPSTGLGVNSSKGLFMHRIHLYLQMNGTAMGANYAPSYANLTMGYWEQLYITWNNPFAAHVVYYGRYVDNIVIIWDGPPQKIAAL